MSVESLLFAALKPLVSNRVYAFVAPQTVTALPRIVFQPVGGDALNFVEGNKPSKKNCRMQIKVWHNEATAAMNLMRTVEDTMRPAAGLQSTVLGAPVGLFEAGNGPNGTDLYGAMQDFSLWYSD